MHYIKTIFFVVLVIAISGCSYIYGENGVVINRDTDYLKARSIPPLKIPPGLSSSTISANYPVSEKDYPRAGMKPDLIPPELNSSSR